MFPTVIGIIICGGRGFVVCFVRLIFVPFHWWK